MWALKSKDKFVVGRDLLGKLPGLAAEIPTYPQPTVTALSGRVPRGQITQ